MTVVLVEHKVEELAVYADCLVAMRDGRIEVAGRPREVLVAPIVEERPQVLDIALQLHRHGCWDGDLPMSVEEAVSTWTKFTRDGESVRSRT